MNRIFGLVGYACNGKTTTLKEIAKEKNYEIIDLPSIYLSLAKTHGYNGVTEWYTSVGLEQYKKESVEEISKYLKEEIPRDKDLIIDDIFDYDIYKKIVKLFPQICLIGIHSFHDDRVKRLGMRKNETKEELLIEGIKIRDHMKDYCGIKKILTKCNTHIENTSTFDHFQKELKKVLNKNLIICILGYSGSGKSTINNSLSKKLNIPCFSYGKYIEKIMKKEGYQKSRDYVIEKGLPSYLKLTNKKMRLELKEFMKDKKTILIDGIVSSEIFNYLCKYHDVLPILIDVEDSLRIKRIQLRENIDEGKGMMELYTKDSIKISNGLDIIISKATISIDGSKSIEEVLESTKKSITYQNCIKT